MPFVYNGVYGLRNHPITEKGLCNVGEIIHDHMGSGIGQFPDTASHILLTQITGPECQFCTRGNIMYNLQHGSAFIRQCSMGGKNIFKYMYWRKIFVDISRTRKVPVPNINMRRILRVIAI